MKFHHVGYLVKNIEKSIRAFEAAGYHLESLTGKDDITYDPLRDSDICFLKNGDCVQGDGYVELVSPKSKESPVYGLLQKYKNGPYHICYESDHPQEEIEALCKKGWIIINEEDPAVALNGMFVVFLMHRAAGIIEIAYKK